MKKNAKKIESTSLVNFILKNEVVSPDFQAVLPLLLYLYHTKSTAMSLLTSMNIQQGPLMILKEILLKLIDKTKIVLGSTINLLQKTEACVVSLSAELVKIIKLKDSSTNYLESFRSNIYIISLNDALNGLISSIMNEKGNFGLLEDDLKSKIIEFSSGITMIKEHIAELEKAYREKKQCESEILQVKARNDLLHFLLDLIILSKKYYQSTLSNNTGQILEYENQMKNFFSALFDQRDVNYQELYHVCLNINAALFAKFKKVVTHESCQESFQSKLSALQFEKTYNQKIYEKLYSFLDQTCTDLLEAAIQKKVLLAFRNEAEKGLLVLFLNYMLLHFTIKQQKGNFPYFSAQSCDEMGPFCNEQNTDWTLNNLEELRGKLTNFLAQKLNKLIERFEEKVKEINKKENFLKAQCEKFGSKDLSSLMEILMNLQKIRVFIFGDVQVSFFVKIMKVNADIVDDNSTLIDEQEEIGIKYCLASNMEKSREIVNLKYLLGEMKHLLTN